MALGWAVLAAGILQLLFLMPALARLDLLVLAALGLVASGRAQGGAG